MAPRSFLLVVLKIGLCVAWVQERPVLETRDGNLIIGSAKDRNITLLTFGKSTINVNDINLLDVSIRAQEAARIVEKWEAGHLRLVTEAVNRLSRTIDGPRGLDQRLRILEIGGDANNTGRGGRPRGFRILDPIVVTALRNLTRRVRNVENSLNIIRNEMDTNECASSPCRHGGTCIRLLGGYQCLCPANWEGQRCNEDVNECAIYAGTDLGCQNGASCTNLPGSYSCSCASGWYGVHCRSKSYVCDAQDSRELCGYGTCVPKTGTVLGYTCICEEGWKSSGTNPACLTDVDECTGRHPACSMNPYVSCMNLPGGYRCAACPEGYTGNGHYCTDIDECAIDNGGCSLTPRVQCINTIGSWNCGPCPTGYQGNGRVCNYVGICAVNNGGCHPLATCVESPGYNNAYPQCNCPAGYHGYGVGPHGCLPGADAANACSSNPCVHGTCHTNGAYFYTCQCNPGFTGLHCESGVDSCIPNPCQNKGVCRSAGGTITCECPQKFTGPRCENQKQSCGGLYKAPNGTLEYPNTEESYPHDLNCAFVILTNASMVLNITFTRFDLEKSLNCRYDFLQIHDGANAGAHQIGRFCGSDFPLHGNFMSTHNAIYLWLRTDGSRSHRGFAIQWNSVLPTCGGFLASDHGTIKSPGSPGRYPNNRDCVWTVLVTPGKRIQFHFFGVMMEEHPTCENDYLEINETTGGRDVQLALYCNHTHPAPLTTSGSDAVLHFHSDGAGSDMGFQISYSAIEGVPGCGGVFTAPSGTITSPRFPSNYPPRMICDWKIQLPRGERFRLNWISFELERHRVCSYDFVRVIAGPDLSSPVVGKYCGSTLPASVTIDSNEALIVFKSDWSNEFKGFQLEYETICGGQFHEPTGVIQSPYYPQSYPASRTCIYEIIQPAGKAIVLTLTDMDIENGFSESCYFDRLAIYDGDNENATSLGVLCGDHNRIPSEPYYSTHNIMYLKFVTDSSMSNRGFSANYTTVDRRCGGLLKSPTGLIQSHTGSDAYAENEECTWTIKAPAGHVVQLTFTSFDLEMAFNCQYDYVVVYDGPSTTGVELARFCGSMQLQPLTSQTESMSIVFRTDGSINAGGFTAHYAFIDATKVCGGHYYAQTGVLNSPNYPHPYPANRECVWVITAPNKRLVNLEVVQFELEGTAKCIYDYLEIRNGAYESSPLIDKYCGTNIPRNIRSLTNQLYIKLVTDSSRHLGGFSFKWDTSTSGCGGTLSGSRGEIISPNYPQPYIRLAVCLWKIVVAAGSKVKLFVIDFDVEDQMSCRYDYLEIRSGSDDSRKPAAKYCGTNVPPYIELESNAATIRFKSDYTNAGRGFHIRYETNCVRKIRGFDGVIESPNFPNNYPPSANCTWTIEAPQGNTLNLTFSHFDLETGSSSGNCTYDYVSIKEGQDDLPNTDLGKFCGTQTLPLISSTQSQVFINFVTDRYDERSGFRLEWNTVGCGGRLTRPNGEFTSPGYPNAYKENVECEWLIEVDRDQSVEITFLDVNTEKIVGCRYDKITLYAGGDETAPKLGELCHSEKPIKYTSSSNKLFVKFVGDFSFAGRGFKASYRAVDITCGGVFNALEGLIHSANYPLDYPRNQNCEWLIEVDSNHVVNLTFTDFDIEDTTNCTDDYVEVYDGALRNATLLGTFCRNVLPEPIISSGNTMLVVMRSDSYVTAKGFSAKFSKACGARIVTNGEGTLETSSLLHMDDSNTNCTWTIIAEDPSDHVTLNFFHMEVSSPYSWDESCDSHYVRVYEGDSVDGPVRGTWCSSKTPPPLTSTGNALTVHLYAEYASTENSFGATYSVLNSACGGEYISVSGTITSPMYPDSYPVDAECVWLLKTSPGNRISLTFSNFEIETSPNCDRDYLEIREDSGIGKLIGVYCTEMPTTVTASKSLWIKFRSDESGTAKGFIGEFNLLHGNELTGVSGEIASPLYPHPWGQDTTITWRITVEFGMAIKIQFDDVHVESYSQSCSAKVAIYDGYNDEAPVLAAVCGVTPPEEPFISNSNVVYLEFMTEYFRDGNWFHLNWYQVPRETSPATLLEQTSGCVFTYDLTSPENASVSFHSPGWPDGYETNLDCTWIIKSPPGHHLAARLNDIDIEQSSNCVSDWVAIYDGYGLSSDREDLPLLNKFCRSNETSVVTTGKSVMTLTFHTDFYQNRTGFRALVWRECGGELHGPNGVIDFNETLTMYGGRMYNYVCEWNVTVRPGRTISVGFSAFNFPTTEGSVCKDHYILLKNGAGAHSPLLGSGKYCGQTGPVETLVTTGNMLYVRVVGARPRINFRMSYEEVGMSCGGSHNLGGTGDTQVHFNTPNYPNIPPPFSECVWKFRALHGERLSLHFVERFDLASTPNCTREYVEVRDGGTEHSKLLGIYCRDTPPSTITTTGDMLYVHFYTDLADPKNGFKAAVTSGQICGGILRGKTGVVRSPNYPAPYPADESCGWWIVAPPDHTIKLEFRDLHLPGFRRCKNTDHVSVGERLPLNDTVNTFGVWCGITKPEIPQTSSNEAIISFHSDNRTREHFRGFSLNYTATRDACGGSLTGTSGEFKSVGYPNPNTRPRFCEWSITVPEGSQVMVEILDLDMGEVSSSDNYDFYLAFYNDKGSMSKIALVRSPPAPRKIYSTSNFMIVAYWFRGGHRGIKASFTAVAPAPCGGIIENMSGSLHPPLPPYNETSFFCSWKLRAPRSMIDSRNRSGSTLTVTISGTIGDYGRRNGGCAYRLKYIRINDGEENVGVACGNMTDEKYTVRSPSPLNVIDIMNSTIGPRISFDLKYEWKACGGIVTGPSHTISAPGNVLYPKSCVWHAKFEDPAASITLTFNRMNMGSCDKAYIIVRNGGPQSPEVGKFCGNIKPPNITSSMNQMWIEYWAVQEPGDFEIQLNQNSGSCGGILRGANREIMSPGFPKKYPNNAECTWVITVQSGHNVGLVFVDRFSLETSNSCTNDFVQIFDWYWDANGVADWREGPKFCGRNIPSTFNATSSRLKVLFRSNEFIQGDGFRAKWEENCGGIFEAKAHEQFIESPNYPDVYSRNRVCNYTLTAPKDREIWVQFVEFEVEGRRGNCKYDNITVLSHPWNNYHTKEDVWCGTVLPPSINSLEVLTLIFKTDSYVQKRGFQFKYFTNECGGEITKPKMISPPSKSVDHYYGRLNCTWIIRAPEGKSVVLRLEKFQIESSHGCVYDRVEIVEGDNLKTGKRLGKLCGNITNMLPVKSSGNVMIVMFRSDGSNDYGGMSASITFATSEANGCGGKINLTSSKPFRTQKSARYDPLEDCHWRVVAEAGKNVRLTISRMDLKNSSTNSTHASAGDPCPGDYLEVRDGTGPMSELIGRYCGNTIPPPIESSTNLMWIRLFTDATYEGEGVVATLEPVVSVCGKSFWDIHNTTEVFASPNFPANFPAGTQCLWTFRSSERYVKLQLHFETLDLEDTKDCDGDHLEIKNVNRPYVSEDFGEEFIFNGRSSRQMMHRMSIYNRDAAYKYCGQAISFDHYSDSSEIRVSLKSTANHMPKPRKFKFDVSRTSGCKRNYTSEQGRIVQQKISDCWTTITTSPNRTISLYFYHFYFYDSPECKNNYVEVHDGDSNAPVLQRLCGFADPSPMYSTGNKLTIHAKTFSDQSFGIEHYDILYTTTDQGRGCGGKLYNYEGLFTSPMYPSSYRNDSVCIWEISVPRGYQVALQFGFFDLGTAELCTTDYLQVEESGDGARTELYCPGVAPAAFRASGNIVKVTYVSSVNNGGTGWQIRFAAVQNNEPLDPPVCGKSFWDIHNTTKVFGSPNFPANFPAGTQCLWTVRSSERYVRLQLYFETLDLQDTKDCDGDHLEIKNVNRPYVSEDFGEEFIFNGRSSRQMIHRMSSYNRDAAYKYCGQATSFDHYSDSSEIRVSLKSTANHMPKPRKFKFDVSRTSGCKRNYTSEQGRIVQQKIYDCWTTITTSPNRTISLNFYHFYFYDSSECKNNYVEIRY